MSAIPTWIWLLTAIGALTSVAAALIILACAWIWHDIKDLWRNW